MVISCQTVSTLPKISPGGEARRHLYEAIPPVSSGSESPSAAEVSVPVAETAMEDVSNQVVGEKVVFHSPVELPLAVHLWQPVPDEGADEVVDDDDVVLLAVHLLQPFFEDVVHTLGLTVTVTSTGDVMIAVIVVVCISVVVCSTVLAVHVVEVVAGGGGAAPHPLAVKVIGKHFAWPKSGCT